MSTINVCLLGGTGFVGHRIAARLAESGHGVTILTRRLSRHRDLLVLPTVRLVEGDVYNPVFLRRTFAGDVLEGVATRMQASVGPGKKPVAPMDAVINLVGILNERGHSGAGFVRAHAELPALVVEACRAAGVKRLLHMSALGASLDAPSHYLRTKAMGEDAALRADGTDMRVTCFRPSVIFGPGDSFTNRFAALLRLAPAFFPLACPDARFQPVYIEDVAQAFVLSLDLHKTFGKRYDLCGPKVYRLRQLIAYIAQLRGRRTRIVGLGTSLSKLQAAVLEFMPGKPFSLDNYRSLQVDNVCAQGAEGNVLTEVFGITPTSLEQIAPAYLAPKR